MPPRRKNPLEHPGGESPDELVSRDAARQSGAFTGAQARKAGLSPTQIKYRVRTGRWIRTGRDVFVLAGTRDTWQRRAMIACLSGPAGTVVSHLSAAAVYGLAQAPEEPHVTIPRDGSGHRISGARVRRADLRPADKALKDRIPCTSAVQTVIDCAEVLDPGTLCDLVDTALCRKLMQPSRLIRGAEAAWRSARRSRRAALGRLLEALEIWRCGAPPGSPPEAKLQRRLKEWGFPPAQRQVEVYGKDGRLLARADLGIVEWKVLLEYDSDEHHGPRRWVADGERAGRVEEETGWRMVPVDRFDLRPSNNNLRDRLEKLRPPGWKPLAA
jgi:Transcriptional regulator, AbiEi antitoxin